MKLADHLDAGGLSLKNAKIDPVSSNPTGLGSGDEGRLIYNTTDDKLRFWNGSSWVELESANGPLGVLGHATSTSTQSGITSITDITDASVTVDVSAGRRIKITAGCSSYWTTNNGTYALSIREGTTKHREALLQSVIANEPVWSETEVVLTPSAGSHTYKLSMQRLSGSGSRGMTGSDTGRAHFILVEDIGAA